MDPEKPKSLGDALARLVTSELVCTKIKGVAQTARGQEEVSLLPEFIDGVRNHHALTNADFIKTIGAYSKVIDALEEAAGPLNHHATALVFDGIARRCTLYAEVSRQAAEIIEAEMPGCSSAVGSLQLPPAQSPNE